MAKEHWQIYNHSAKKRKDKEGDAQGIPVKKAPKEVIEVALRAAALIGNGLYGVDIKITPKGPVVIEVNDNPNIDAGEEDQIAGDALYHTILKHFVQMIEAA